MTEARFKLNQILIENQYLVTLIALRLTNAMQYQPYYSLSLRNVMYIFQQTGLNSLIDHRKLTHHLSRSCLPVHFCERYRLPTLRSREFEIPTLCKRIKQLQVRCLQAMLLAEA